MPLSFQRHAAGKLDATYHFVFTGQESAEATVTVRAGKLNVESCRLGNVAWISRGRAEPLWALVTRRVRLTGNPK